MRIWIIILMVSIALCILLFVVAFIGPSHLPNSPGMQHHPRYYGK